MHKTSETEAALRNAAEGLSYQSETDAPWEAFAWPSATGTPDPNGIRAAGKHKADAPVSEQGVDEFFAPLVKVEDWFGDDEKAEAARYQTLLDAVQARLSGPKVVTVGERKKAVYVVGAAKEGGWAGVKTTAVET